jgi:hypothetical protein
VYQFTKILDPGSVVRESEYAMSANNAGAINRARQYLTAIQTGKILTPDQVAQMKDVVRNLYTSYRQRYEGVNNTFKEIADRKGVDYRNIVIDPYISDITSPKTATYSNMKPQDNEALEWANKNPNDPRAKAIKQKLGVK